MVRHAEILLAADPQRAGVRLDFAMAQMRQATAMPPKSAEAITLMSRALGTMEELRAADPGNNSVARQMGPFFHRLAARHAELDQHDQSAALLRRYASLAEAAAERDKQDAFHRSWLLSTYERLAEDAMRRGEWAGARELATRAERRLAEHRAIDGSGSLKDLYAKTETWMAKARQGR